MKKVTIYADGACSGNPGPGGWGALLIYNGVEKELSGYENATTNNRMELTAVIEALKALKSPCDVVFYTDSKYVQQGISEWITNWQKNNWRTSNKKPVKNQDLWQELALAASRHKIDWQWVKGHNGTRGNEITDQLAREAILKAKV